MDQATQARKVTEMSPEMSFCRFAKAGQFEQSWQAMSNWNDRAADLDFRTFKGNVALSYERDLSLLLGHRSY